MIGAMVPKDYDSSLDLFTLILLGNARQERDTNMKLVLIDMHSTRLKKVVISWENWAGIR